MGDDYHIYICACVCGFVCMHIYTYIHIYNVHDLVADEVCCLDSLCPETFVGMQSLMFLNV